MAYMIMDLQYGSTGKGLLAGYMAEKYKPDTLVTAWGPNAGHTYIDGVGRKFVHTMLANGIVSPKFETLLIGPGTVLDWDTLVGEVLRSRHLMAGKTIIIHPQVAILDKKRHNEGHMIKIGSTMKGTAQAMMQRMMRDPDDMNTAEFFCDPLTRQFLSDAGHCYVLVSANEYRWALERSKLMQIEGAQGYGLSMYHGFYPYVTSRDVTPHQILADCAIPYDFEVDVIGTMRTFPIRVANRIGPEGQIFTSGPCYPDQHEMSWEELDMEPELTTVTKLPRRIFNFSTLQMHEAITQCSPREIFLNFCNYLPGDKLDELLKRIESRLPDHCRIRWLGNGPMRNDVEDRETGEWG